MHDVLSEKRSIQTIRDHTSVIDTHVLQKHLLQIRTLDNEDMTLPQDFRFIVTFKDDVDNADATVKPLAEAVLLGDRVRFIVKPVKQYPELSKMMNDFIEVIEFSIRRFFDQNGRMMSSQKANGSAEKWLLH